MKISEALFVGIDTETTGTDPERDQLVEIASRSVYLDDLPLTSTFSTLVCPTIAIPPESSAVHHLVERDVRWAPKRDEALSSLLRAIDRSSDVVFFAHNAAFDRAFLPELSQERWLCTMRLAQHVWPDAPNFKNQVLRYWLGHADLNLEGLAPHRASADLIVTEAILRDAVAAYLEQGGTDDIDALIDYAASPVLLKNMPFGKHRGPMEHVPTDYIQWALGPRGLTDIDGDLRYTLEHALKVRAEAA